MGFNISALSFINKSMEEKATMNMPMYVQQTTKLVEIHINQNVTISITIREV